MSETHATQADSDAPRFDVLCLIMGWLWPGLGYFRIRQPRRGWLVMTGVLSMLLIGLLVGGLDVVDRQNRFLWFLPQSLNGPLAFLADYLARTIVRSGKAGTIGIVHVADIGILFVALGGLLNLASMIDCATRPLDSNFRFDRWERRGAEPRQCRASDRTAQDPPQQETTTPGAPDTTEGSTS